MKRYNLTVRIIANVSVYASSDGAAKQAIQGRLERHSTLTNMPEFVIEDVEITGIFDIDWNEIEEQGCGGVVRDERKPL